MPIILKAANAITKELLKAAISHMNRFLKAAGVGISLLYSFQRLSETRLYCY
jgi:hypothetical protein